MTTRSQAAIALFNLVSTITWGEGQAFVTKDRRLRHFSKVSRDEQPAIFQGEHNETIGQITRMPSKVIMDLSLVIYHQASLDPSVIGADYNSAIIEAILFALAPLPGTGDRQSLGGIVHHCWVEGSIFKEPGDDETHQGMLVIPVRIMLP